MKTKKKIVREQIDGALSGFALLKKLRTPPLGWIRSIREGLGMSGRQLARRLNTSKQSVARLEQDEVVGSITIKTLRKVAESLDCVLVYSLIPRTSLEDTVRKRAEEVARERLKIVDQTMVLEKQKIKDKNLKNLFSEDVEGIMNDMPRDLWD